MSGYVVRKPMIRAAMILAALLNMVLTLFICGAMLLLPLAAKKMMEHEAQPC